MHHTLRYTIRNWSLLSTEKILGVPILEYINLSLLHMMVFLRLDYTKNTGWRQDLSCLQFYLKYNAYHAWSESVGTCRNCRNASLQPHVFTVALVGSTCRVAVRLPDRIGELLRRWLFQSLVDVAMLALAFARAHEDAVADISHYESLEEWQDGQDVVALGSQWLKILGDIKKDVTEQVGCLINPSLTFVTRHFGNLLT